MYGNLFQITPNNKSLLHYYIRLMAFFPAQSV